MIYLPSVDSSGSYLPNRLADSKGMEMESYFNSILPSTIFFSTITFERYAGRRAGGTFCLGKKLSYFDLAMNLDPYEKMCSIFLTAVLFPLYIHY